MISIDFEVKGQNALELSQYLKNPLSRYKVKGQASVNIGKYFLRLKYIEFLSNFVHCHIWRSRDSGTFDF